MSLSPRSPKPLLALSSVILFIPLALHGVFGLYSRYLADDYCTAGQYRSLGFLPSLQYWYTNWSGRYAFYFFINLTHWIGTWITPYLTALTVIAWLAILYALARRFLRVLHAPQPALQTLLLASVVLFAILDGTPDIYQSLYWQTGLITYLVPLLFFSAFMAWLLECTGRTAQNRSGWGTYLASAGLTWIAGGFSETYASMQIAALLVLLMVTALLARGEPRRAGMAVLASGLVGALAALITIAAAPGNAVRMGLMPDRLSLPELVFWSLRHSLAFSAKSFIDAPVSFLSALLAPGLLALTFRTKEDDDSASLATQPSKVISLLIGAPFVVFILIAASIIPAVYATAAYPAERALVTAQFLLICGIAAWSLLASLIFRKYVRKLASRPVLIGVALVLTLFPGAVLSSQKTLNKLHDAQTYASLWDERDQEIRRQVAAGVREIDAVSLPHMSPGLAELSEDPGNWINQCLALSYGLRRVGAK